MELANVERGLFALGQVRTSPPQLLGHFHLLVQRGGQVGRLAFKRHVVICGLGGANVAAGVRT